MDQLLTPQFFAQFGLSGIIAFLAIKAVTKLYSDMREDSKTREDKLMIHLDKVTGTLDNVNDTLKEVKFTLKDLNNRVEIIEDCVKSPKEDT